MAVNEWRFLKNTNNNDHKKNKKNKKTTKLKEKFTKLNIKIT
jgi:hypothetical protein